MSEDARADERIRAFVALDLPASVRTAVADWQRSAIADRGDLRPVRPEALHLTLAFLGHIDPDLLARAVEIVDSAAEGAGPVPIRLGTEPFDLPRRRPRVIALAVEGAAAIELQAELSGRLLEAGVYRPGSSPFRPHLTVARVRSPRSGGRSARLCEGLPRLPAEAGHTFGAVRIALYRSRLGPGGASYTALTAFELPPLEGAADEVI